jgi:hypothetical protein
LHHAEGERRWFRCDECAMVHLDPALRPSSEDERARYDLHQNNPEDADYVAFLRRLADPMVERLPVGARGLDFGCGPAPVLATTLTAAGFPCEAYDPFYFPDPEPLSHQHDFIACSEVVEHLHDPAATFTLFASLLSSGGTLGVMTRFLPEDTPFADWWYRRDPTHVCFYAASTMRWIATRHGWSLELPRPDVALFGSRSRPAS